MNQTIQRVTIVTETFAPEINGVAHTLSQLVTGMRQRGIGVQIIRPRQSKRDVPPADPDFETVTLPGIPIPGYEGLKFGVPLTNRISAALKRFQPQAVYVATEGPMGWAAVRASRKAGVPIFSGFHTNFHQYIRHYRLAGLEKIAYQYLKYFHNLTNATLVPTRVQRDQLASSGYKNVSVMARGVNSDLFTPAKRSTELRKRWGVEEDDLVLLYVGRIAGEKNLDLALSTYEQLSKTDEQVKLVLVGDGPELSSIKHQFPEAIFCGMRTGTELAEHYASGDIFLFPSKTDTFGNVVTEAMASGLAVVSFDYAAAHEHISHGENGMLVPFGSDEKFIHAVATLVDSPNLLAGIRSKARHTAKSISWNSIVEDFITRLSADAASAPVKVNNHDSRKAEHGKNRITVQ